MAKRKRRPGKETPQLDIVIPVYGQPELLQKCLDGIAQQDIKTQIIIVDDCGPDQLKLTEIYNNAPARIIRNRKNSGFARTVNRGVTAGNAPLILILNSDVELTRGALPAMMAEFENESVGTVGCKLLFPESSTDPTRPGGKIQHAGMAVDIDGRFIHAYVGWDADHPKVNVRRTCQAVTGACLMTRRSVWNAILRMYKNASDITSGALNEVYGDGTYEDVEYCFATRIVGKEVVYTPSAVGYHCVGGSVIPAGRGYPMRRNAMIFGARCGTLVEWDEWMYS